MYRQNKLKEELDRLRKENENLKIENAHLEGGIRQRDAIIENLNSRIINQSLSEELQLAMARRPIVVQTAEEKWLMEQSTKDILKRNGIEEDL